MTSSKVVMGLPVLSALSHVVHYPVCGLVSGASFRITSTVIWVLGAAIALEFVFIKARVYYAWVVSIVFSL